MPEISGVLETSLYVEDVARAAEFYRSLFGFEAMIQDQRFCAFSVVGKQVLLLFRRGSALLPTTIPGGVIPPHDGSGQLHLAFAIPTAAMPAWEARLAAHNVAIESKVVWPGGGHSVYFRDPDSHLVELVTPGCWPIY
jgi:catechol 2,3-dioxygenase-like lactoylglutathione lyase family enzyme